jgi:hypothetical protein
MFEHGPNHLEMKFQDKFRAEEPMHPPIYTSIFPFPSNAGLDEFQLAGYTFTPQLHLTLNFQTKHSPVQNKNNKIHKY